ncbi:hypothetical protein J6590_056768 [Homalodisca vitripennis]|nr:hypothetical protein J6590_056768 [Homalodisca vitripennis]
MGKSYLSHVSAEEAKDHSVIASSSEGGQKNIYSLKRATLREPHSLRDPPPLYIRPLNSRIYPNISAFVVSNVPLLDIHRPAVGPPGDLTQMFGGIAGGMSPMNSGDGRPGSRTLLSNVVAGVASLAASRDAASCVDAFWKMPHKGLRSRVSSVSAHVTDPCPSRLIFKALVLLFRETCPVEEGQLVQIWRRQLSTALGSSIKVPEIFNVEVCQTSGSGRRPAPLSTLGMAITTSLSPLGQYRAFSPKIGPIFVFAHFGDKDNPLKKGYNYYFR